MPYYYCFSLITVNMHQATFLNTTLGLDAQWFYLLFNLILIRTFLHTPLKMDIMHTTFSIKNTSSKIHSTLKTLNSFIYNTFFPGYLLYRKRGPFSCTCGYKWKVFMQKPHFLPRFLLSNVAKTDKTVDQL